nr:cupin domain-containing protein [Govania unica]
MAGRRSLNDLDDGPIISDDRQVLRYLSSDLLHKAFTPIVATIKATSAHDYDQFHSHDGEEFVYVISGVLEFHSEFYAPVRLNTGQSIYFDSSMLHAYVSVGEDLCRVLSICSKPEKKPL